MCVIMGSEVGVPTDEMIEAGFEKNKSGAGVAWIEKDKKGTAWVRWVKGLTDVGEVKKLVAKISAPMIAHFRIPTEGLDDIALTHPFPVNHEASLAFEGKTQDRVLFHNGGWDKWRSFSLDTALKSGVKLPDGLLNDSRMMAWCASIYGPSVLQLIDQRVMVFGTDGIQMFGPEKSYTQQGWDYNHDAKVWVSNDLWESCLPKKPEPVHVKSQVPHIAAPGGGRNPVGFQPGIAGQLGSIRESLPQGGPEQKQVEGRETHHRASTEQVRKSVNQNRRHALLDDLQLRLAYSRLHGADLAHFDGVEMSTLVH